MDKQPDEPKTTLLYEMIGGPFSGNFIAHPSPKPLETVQYTTRSKRHGETLQTYVFDANKSQFVFVPK